MVFVSVIYFFDHLDLFRISDFGFRISYLSGIMALRQNYPIRLLIADDVGVGKTIEKIFDCPLILFSLLTIIH